jgi:hypothetical protein
VENNQKFIFRVYGDGSYGVGQMVIPGVAFFAKDNYGLTKAEALKKFNQLRGNLKRTQ